MWPKLHLQLWTAPFRGLNSGWRETSHCSVIPWLVAPCNTGPVWCGWCGWARTMRKPRWRWECQLQLMLMRFISLCTLRSWSEEDFQSNSKLSNSTLIEVVFLFTSQPGPVVRLSWSRSWISLWGGVDAASLRRAPSTSQLPSTPDARERDGRSSLRGAAWQIEKLQKGTVVGILSTFYGLFLFLFIFNRGLFWGGNGRGQV